LNAADKKASGGSWGDALKAGAVGGAMGAIPGGAIGSAAKGAAAGAGIKSVLGAVGKSVLTNPGTLATVGSTLSGGAKGMADARAAQNSNAILQDRMRADDVQNYERSLVDRAKLDMDQRELDTKTRQGGFNDALRAQYLHNWQPAQRPSRIPMVSGGFNTVPQSSRDLAAQFERQALIRALEGESFDAMPDIERFTPTAMKDASGLEKLAGASGLGLSGAAAILDALSKERIKARPGAAVGLDDEPWLGDFGG
jgi:hypothetical protein